MHHIRARHDARSLHAVGSVTCASRPRGTARGNMTHIELTPARGGVPFACGAIWDGNGTNFALFSANATGVELCLFDPEGKTERQRIQLPEFTNQVWHGYVRDV